MRQRGLTIQHDNERCLLQAYASGSGSLSLVTVKVGDPMREALAHQPTEDQVRKLRDLVYPGYQIFNATYLSERPVFELHKPVKRIDTQTLRLDGKDYRYEVTYESPDKSFRQYRFTTDLNGEEIEVQNISTTGSLRFYLNHESAILDQSTLYGNREALAAGAEKAQATPKMRM